MKIEFCFYTGFYILSAEIIQKDTLQKCEEIKDWTETWSYHFRLPPLLFSLWFKTCDYVLDGVAVGLGVWIIWKSGITDEAFLFPLENTSLKLKINSRHYLLLI